MYDKTVIQALYLSKNNNVWDVNGSSPTHYVYLFGIFKVNVIFF